MPADGSARARPWRSYVDGDGRVLLVATRSRGKRAELHLALGPLGYRLVDLDTAGVPPTAAEDGVEVFSSFEGNALAKARFYSAASGGLPTIADDSGLAVDALGGAPGVVSRRWSGASGSEAEVSRANNAKLLGELSGGRARGARFVCAIALVDGPETVVVRGEVAGRIADAPRGTGGFGYDALFECEALGWRTFAEVGAEEKARVSHRGKAVAALVAQLATQSGPDRAERAG